MGLLILLQIINRKHSRNLNWCCIPSDCREEYRPCRKCWNSIIKCYILNTSARRITLEHRCVILSKIMIDYAVLWCMFCCSFLTESCRKRREIPQIAFLPRNAISATRNLSPCLLKPHLEFDPVRYRLRPSASGTRSSPSLKFKYPPPKGLPWFQWILEGESCRDCNGSLPQLIEADQNKSGRRRAVGPNNVIVGLLRMRVRHQPRKFVQST